MDNLIIVEGRRVVGLKVRKLGLFYDIVSSTEHDVEVLDRKTKHSLCFIQLGSVQGRPRYFIGTDYGVYTVESFPTIRAAIDYFLGACKVAFAS